MNIIFLGDIVGKSGREIVRDLLPSLKEKYNCDLIIANGENAAHGKGLTLGIYEELLSYGIDYLTMGNHTYEKENIISNISKMNRLIVPNNYIEKIGSGFRVVDVNGVKDQYESFQEILDHVKADIFFVDLHAEATAEKRLFAEYFKSHVQVVVGTHTHIQTADEMIIDGKTAFISDVGMCGPYKSIIGRSIEETINANILHQKTRYEMALGPAILNAVIIEIVNNTPIKIERIQIRPY